MSFQFGGGIKKQNFNSFLASNKKATQFFFHIVLNHSNYNMNHPINRVANQLGDIVATSFFTKVQLNLTIS